MRLRASPTLIQILTLTLIVIPTLSLSLTLSMSLSLTQPLTLNAEVQRRTAQAIGEGRDCIVTAETGSGKTLAFLMPTLARLTYPDGIDEETQARFCSDLHNYCFGGMHRSWSLSSWVSAKIRRYASRAYKAFTR